MSEPFHLHFIVHGPWSFTWDDDPPEFPGTSASEQFRQGNTFVAVDLPDGGAETRTIPCRIAKGEVGRVHSQVVPVQVRTTRIQRKDALA